jgi:hypothetical protein
MIASGLVEGDDHTREQVTYSGGLCSRAWGAGVVAAGRTRRLPARPLVRGTPLGAGGARPAAMGGRGATGR